MKKIILASAMALVTTSASAETLRFIGTVASTCTLSANTPGVLTLAADGKTLDTTTEAGVQAVTTAPTYKISTTAPTDWTTAPANTPATTFEVKHKTTGPLIDVASTASIDIPVGLTPVSVSLKATGTDYFRQGVHQADVTVTCELR